MLEEDEPLLRQHAKECRDVKEAIRYYALHTLSEGKTITEVAGIFLVERQAIYDWMEKWKTEKNLSDKPRSGRPADLTEEDDKELERLLKEKDPGKYGLNSATYTTKELKEYFLKYRNKVVDEETLRKHLHKIGAKYVKGQIVYKEADLNAQIEWAKSFYYLATDYGFTKIFFMDEMAVWKSAHNGYGWTLDQRLIVEAPQRKNEKANYFGAVDVMDGEVTEIISKSAKKATMMKFLEKIESEYPNDKILICMDNGRVHVSKVVRKFFEERDNVKLLFLPPYSPQMNPEEYFHNFVRCKQLNNNNFDSIKSIGIRVSNFVKRLDRETVKSIATLIPIEQLLSFQIESV
jgi:transposase